MINSILLVVILTQLLFLLLDIFTSVGNLIYTKKVYNNPNIKPKEKEKIGQMKYIWTLNLNKPLDFLAITLNIITAALCFQIGNSLIQFAAATCIFTYLAKMYARSQCARKIQELNKPLILKSTILTIPFQGNHTGLRIAKTYEEWPPSKLMVFCKMWETEADNLSPEDIQKLEMCLKAHETKILSPKEEATHLQIKKILNDAKVTHIIDIKGIDNFPRVKQTLEEILQVKPA